MDRLDRRAAARTLSSAVAAVAFVVAGSARAKDEAPTGPRPGAGHHGVFVTPKVGGIVPFGGLGPNVTGGLDVGYALPMGLTFGVAADYAQPTKSGSEADARVAGGTYAWHLTQQILQVMPFVGYRLRGLGALVPYAAIGPRVYLLRSTVRGDGPTFGETREQSTKVGIGLPLGLELAAGPGAAVAELLLQYGALDHATTGDSNTGAASLSLGYRLMF